MEGLDFVFVYLDDILINLANEVENRHHLRELHHIGLTINIGKSEFYKKNLNFLGFKISSAGLQPN